MDPILNQDDEQTKALQEALMSRYKQAQNNDEIDAAKGESKRANLIAGIGQALETMARAKGVARGGNSTNTQLYQGIEQQGRQGVTDAINKRQQEIAQTLQEMNMQRAMAGDKRAEKELGLHERQTVSQEEQRKADNEFKKAAGERDDSRLGLESERLDQDKADRAAMRDLKTQEMAARQQELSNKLGEQGRTDSLKLTKEYMDHPITKETNVVLSAYDKLSSVAKADPEMKTGAAQMAAIFAYMKLQDPNSSVREGEYANAKNAGGVSSKIANAYNSLMDGKILDPQVVKEFVSTAGTIKQAQLGQQKRINDEFRSMAQRYHLDPDQVVGSGAVSGTYPKQVRNAKTGQAATVANPDEEKEAAAEGFN